MSFILNVVSSEGVKTWMETHGYTGLKKQETNQWIWGDYCSWKEREKKSYTADLQKGKIPNSLLKSLVWNLNLICTWQIKKVQIRLKRVRHDWATSTHIRPKDLNRNLAAALYREDRFWSMSTAMLTTFFKKSTYLLYNLKFVSFFCMANECCRPEDKAATHITKVNFPTAERQPIN